MYPPPEISTAAQRLRDRTSSRSSDHAVQKGPVMKVLAYIHDQDWGLVRTRLQPTPMRPDGRLEVRHPASPGDRLVLPTVFLGRRDDGRLGFLCDLLDSAQS